MKAAMLPVALSALLLILLAGVAPVQAGEPTYTVDQDVRGAMLLHASIEIAAAPAIVWTVITDCDRTPSYVPNMESCRITQRDPSGRWQVRATVMNVALLPRINTLSRLEFEPRRRMTFAKVGGDMKIAEGEWRLEPLARGKATRLSYSSALALNFFVPRFLLNQAAARDVPAMMKNIERESLKDAERR